MNLYDRLGCACIGTALGAVLGFAGWCLYGSGFSRVMSGGIDPSLAHRIKYCGGAFAIIGFIFQDRVGDALGGTINVLVEAEARDTSSSFRTWFIVIVVADLIFAGWYFLK